MPTLKYSALDPSGTWQGDAMDQVEQWNANRGDQWSRYALSLAQQAQDRAAQQAQEDWRRDVAMRQLALAEKQWQGGREDSAQERALRLQDLAAERALRERGLGMQERRFNWEQSQLENEYNRAAKQREEEDAFYQNFDPASIGITEPNAAAAIKRLAQSGKRGREIADMITTNMLARGMQAQARPEERKAKGEDVRSQQASAILGSLGGRQDLTPTEYAAYQTAAQEMERQGYGPSMTQGMTKRADIDMASEAQVKQLLNKAEELTGGMWTYVSDSDISKVSDMMSELNTAMKRAGYSPNEINTMKGRIADKLAKSGWDLEDINAAIYGG